MKILMATMGLDIGGAETHIVELAKELRRQGHDVVIASNGGVYLPEIEGVGILHYKVPMNRRSIPLMIKSYFMLRRAIRKEKPDVVHAHARIPAFICGLLKKTMKFPFVTTAHWVFDTGGALRWLSNWGDKTIAVSEDIKEYLIKNYSLSEKNIFVTINGIDTEKFSPDVSGEGIRREFDIGDDVPLISHVSRMDESRALAARFLIDTAEGIAKSVPGAVILIVGGGDVFDELARKAEEANSRIGYRCVIMAGPRTDINAVVAAGDIFVGVSRAALEAMAEAKPVVVAGNEGYMGIFTPDKLDVGIEGNFCCRGCPMIEAESFQADVTQCLTLQADEKKRLGKYGRQVVREHYSVERMARDSMAAYRAAVPPKRVVMSGYYGFGNAGDEAILEAVYDNIKRVDGNAHVTVLSKDPETTSSLYGCDAAPRFQPIRLRKAIKNCDVLISGGGSLLQDTTSTRSILYYLMIIRLAERLGKRVILYANGIGPVTKAKNRRLVKEAVEKADAVSLRDQDSLNELRSMGVTREDLVVTADPVFLLPEPDKERVDQILSAAGVPEGAFITVAPRPWAESAGIQEKLAKICDRISRKYGRNIVFIAMQPKRDEPVCRAVAALMETRAYIVSGNLRPREIMGVIGRGDMVFSMRLHSLIFAARMATPAAGLVYDPKVKAYLELLAMPSAGDISSLDVDQAVERISAILDDLEGISVKLTRRRDQIVELAEKNDQILRKFLG